MERRRPRLPLAIAIVIWLVLILGTAAVEVGLQSRQITRCQTQSKTDSGDGRCAEEHRSWSSAIWQALGVGALTIPLVGRYAITPDRLPNRIRRLGAPFQMPLDDPRTRRHLRVALVGLIGGFLTGMVLIPIWYATTPADASLRSALTVGLVLAWGAFCVSLGMVIHWRRRYGSS
jgi:hypothetical protein